MKKIISILTICFLALCLVGCGSNDDKNDDVTTVTWWVHQENSWNIAHQELADAYMATHENVKIEIEIFPYDDFESKVQTSLINGEGGADIYEIWGGWGIDFAPTGALLKLDDELANKIMAESYAPTYGALVANGGLYGVPCEFNTETGGLLVNYNVAKANNIANPVPATWEEMIANAKAVSQLDETKDVLKGFDFVNWDSVPYLFLSMILQQGGEYLVSDNEINVNTKEAKTAFETLTNLVLVDGVSNLEGLTGGSDMEGYQQLYAGRCLYVPRGPWSVAEGVNTFELALGEDFGYVELPWWSGNVAYVVENGWSIAGNAKTAHPEIVNDFLNFVYEDENMLKLNVACSQIPSKRSIAESDEYVSQMEYVKPLLSILDEAEFIGFFNTDRLKEAVNDAFVNYCLGEYASVDDALADLNVTLNSIFE